MRTVKPKTGKVYQKLSDESIHRFLSVVFVFLVLVFLFIKILFF